MEPSATLGAAGITLEAKSAGGRHTLAGTKLFVPDAHTADAIVVAARTGAGTSPEDGVSLFLVPRATPGLEVKLLPTMDQTRKLCEVTLTGVTLGADALMGEAEPRAGLRSRACSTAPASPSAPRCAAARRRCST